MSHKDYANVKTIPPLIPLIFIVLGWLLNKYIYNLPIPMPQYLHLPVAYGAMFVALLLFAFSLYFFIKTRQNPEPRTPTNALYTGGIFRVTRNPIYLGFVVAQIMVAVRWDNLYLILFIPVTVILLNKWVIEAEEIYLEGLFGQDYVQYKQKVRRWI